MRPASGLFEIGVRTYVNRSEQNDEAMAQNIYDDPAFFSGYSRLPRQTDGLAAAPEWPVLRAMLPPLAGRRVVDLGCGFGWFARFAREQGAASVLGIDVSENMIAQARRDTDDDRIVYRVADLETLDLPEASFDLAYSSLAFHYVADFARLADALANALVPGGDLVFSIEHPIFMAAANPRWIDDGGRKTWPVNDYAREGERRTDWFVQGVLKHHRRLSTTVNVLISAGFIVRQIEEFAPNPAQIANDPALEVELERPMFLLVSARRMRVPR